MLVIAQITDCHVVEAGQLLYNNVDTASRLGRAVAHINAMHPQPDLVLATGDLVNDGRPAQYDNLVRILARLEAPLYAIPGNHDIPHEVRSRLGAHLDSGSAAEGHRTKPASSSASGTHDYVVDVSNLRLIGLDTTIANQHDGELTSAQLAWLDATLQEDPHVPVVIFQHHPPFTTGIAWMDESGLANPDLEAAVITKYPNVLAVLCGHIHRPIQSLVGGAVASVCPSTGVQVALALDGTPYAYVDEPGAIGVHLFSPSTGLVSHISQVGSPASWTPPWAQDLL